MSPSMSIQITVVLSVPSSTYTSTISMSPSTSIQITVVDESSDFNVTFFDIIFATVSVSILLCFLTAVCLVIFTICLLKKQKQSLEAENDLAQQETCQSNTEPEGKIDHDYQMSSLN